MKGMEAIGNTASSIASNTRFKVDEMNMVNRRAEILKDFGAKAYELWQKGAHFPEELEEQLQELGKLDEKLNDLRAERFAGVQVKEKEEAPAKEAAEETAETAGEAASDIEDTAKDAAEAVTEEIEEAAATVTEAAEEIAETFDDPAEEAKESIRVIRVETPAETRQSGPTLSETINSLFEKVPSADEAVEKVNSALDSLESGLKQFSDGLDEKIDDLTKKINGEE
jgi:peptidoglycan hydrolase CwlO-like protein